jgi:hypothetical protein
VRSPTAISIAACAIALFPGGVLGGASPGGGGKMELPPVTVRYTVQGAYEVKMSGNIVGREDFIRTYMSNNTVIYESVFDVVEGEGAAVSGSNKLEVEEDSGYPKSYYTRRSVSKSDGETVREVSVQMVANVAVVSERQGDEEKQRIVDLPTGCLFVEGNICHHIAEVLDRYDRGRGGKQTFRAFDPLGVGTTDVSLELVGDSTFVDTKNASLVPSASGKMAHYRYVAGTSPAADVFVDADGTIVSIDAASSATKYVLVSLEKRTGKDGSEK